MWRSDAQMALLADNSKPALQHTLLYGLFYSKRKYHFVKENNGNEKDSKHCVNISSDVINQVSSRFLKDVPTVWLIFESRHLISQKSDCLIRDTFSLAKLADQLQREAVLRSVRGAEQPAGCIYIVC